MHDDATRTVREQSINALELTAAPLQCLTIQRALLPFVSLFRMVQNKAAWIFPPSAQSAVEESTTPRAGPGEIVIKNAAVAIDPIDEKIQYSLSPV
ncbi:hypothetical protein AA0119_g13270 [Alternaria tenuissima]|uniref:Uncharacterized protein n=2 Tax=Alternaria alternata complex TaxID=187734 RepID=A0A4V1WPE9_ALTAL|nr:hypothetical protein AA0117_g13080 [Alternaria alternata]RYN85238.1 hypothetical protein AA0119_g13270 [Alternaria tenuissima]RYO00926.1 hypothetical protein AA0121_g13329 [Alternaria tenuissima]RYO47966.1 hypothetical protein AA0116_g12932 [Alternaria tenuissima]